MRIRWLHWLAFSASITAGMLVSEFLPQGTDHIPEVKLDGNTDQVDASDAPSLALRHTASLPLASHD